MGCISSKGVGRSMSIHDRFNQGFHALAIGEDFHMNSRQRDRIITLIKIASGKNLTGFRYVESDDEIGTSCTKPCSSINEEKEMKIQASESTKLQESSNLGHKQSMASETDQIDQGSATSRSFHTLEEFEELVEKVKLFEARIIESAYGRVEFESVPSDSPETLRLSDDGDTTCPEDKVSQDNKEEDIPLAITSKNLDTSAGWKRKAMGGQLESLILPISAKAELSSVGSLKEWINAGDDIYSPETYMTPKFGSYAIERREFGMFSPELVAAFEECMRQMDAEEAGIVKQMEETFTS